MMNLLISFIAFFNWLSSGVYADTTLYPACIDDSDCVNLGHKYACFMYMCYPWKEPDKENHPTCVSDWDCWEKAGKCYRHDRVRQMPKGVCFKSITQCFSHSDCGEDERCCGKHCCPSEYFEAWREFSCYSDIGCQSLKLGSKCCADTKKCCGGEDEESFFSTLSPYIFEEDTAYQDYAEEDEPIEQTEAPAILIPEEESLPSTTIQSWDDEEEVLCEINNDSYHSSSSSIFDPKSFLILAALINSL